MASHMSAFSVSAAPRGSQSSAADIVVNAPPPAQPSFATRWARKSARFISENPCICISLCVIGVILIVSLVPASYHAVEFDEYALDRYTLTNNVDYNTVYDNGNWFTGVSHEMITFPRTFNYEVFEGTQLTVFSEEGLEYSLQCSFQWRLVRERIPEIHKQFRLAYRQQVLNRVISAIKNTMTLYPIVTIITNRALIDAVLTHAVSAAVESMGVEIPGDKFQLDKPILPDSVRSKLLVTQVQLILNDEQRLRQQESLVIQETNVIVSNIVANATRVVTEGAAQAARIVSEAQSGAFATVETAAQLGLASMFTQLGVTRADTKAKLKLILAAETMPNSTRVYYNLQKATATVAL